MTILFVFILTIIPYQELLGNYNAALRSLRREYIIPYQELLGNYNKDRLT